MKKIIVLNTLGKYIPNTQDMTRFKLKNVKTRDLIYTYDSERRYMKDFSPESKEYTVSLEAYNTLQKELSERNILEVLSNDSYVTDTF